MNVAEMTVEQLKALAYDQLATIEKLQNNLRIINVEISKRNVNTAPQLEVS